MPKIDIANVPIDSRSTYPEPFNRVVVGRSRKRLGNTAGLDQFGVNLTTLKPGAASALRHWHEMEDELVYILEGEVVLSALARKAVSIEVTGQPRRRYNNTLRGLASLPLRLVRAN